MKINDAITRIIDTFKQGDIPKAIAYSCFPAADIPCEKWSQFNRTIIHLYATLDARGYKQWQSVGRHVKRGAKAIPILAPRVSKSKDDQTGEEDITVTGYMAVPVFRYEDTEGDPLDYMNIQLPPLPLEEVAIKWGLSIKGIPHNHPYLGYFSNAEQEIALATPEECVFFHELAHASHARIISDIKSIPRWEKEVIAELSAASLALLTGRRMHLGNHFRYIEQYAQMGKTTTLKACMAVSGMVEQVVREIMPVRV